MFFNDDAKLLNEKPYGQQDQQFQINQQIFNSTKNSYALYGKSTVKYTSDGNENIQFTSAYTELPFDQTTESRIVNQEDESISANLYPQMSDNKQPQIVSIKAKCFRNSMQVRITYDEPFDGLVYPKGFFNEKTCHIIQPGSGQLEFEFTLHLNRCGTKFINLTEKGRSYLENTLIFQSNSMFQETSDLSKRLRCLWTDQRNQIVASKVDVAKLNNQQTITYNGDLVEGYMDVRHGHGIDSAPLHENEYVKIGDDLTLMIYLIGNETSKYDLNVKECIAHDGNISNSIKLTDEFGCILRKKVMGSWQKSNSIQAGPMSYSFIKAFKFPDKMDVFFECNIDICKGNCIDQKCNEQEQISQNYDQNNGYRIKRNIPSEDTLTEVLKLVKRVKIFTSE